MPPPFKIAVVDDHPLLRQGIAAIIEADKRFRMCGQADSAHQTLGMITAAKPDILILDITLGGTNGIEVLKDIRAQFPELRVLMLSMHDEKIYAPRSLKAGASGYLNKSQAADKLTEALLKISRGECYLSPEMNAATAHQKLGTQTTIDLLTDRELGVLQMIGNGYRTREIAEKLGLSIKTIESHRAHIKTKLNLITASELVRYAVQWVTEERGGKLLGPE